MVPVEIRATPSVVWIVLSSSQAGEWWWAPLRARMELKITTNMTKTLPKVETLSNWWCKVHFECVDLHLKTSIRTRLSSLMHWVESWKIFRRQEGIQQSLRVSSIWRVMMLMLNSSRWWRGSIILLSSASRIVSWRCTQIIKLKHLLWLHLNLLKSGSIEKKQINIFSVQLMLDWWKIYLLYWIMAIMTLMSSRSLQKWS